MQKYHVHSVPAIIGGALSAVGSCALLVADVGTLSNLTVDKALMPVIVGLTVLTGHLAWQAWHELKFLSCIGLIIVSSVGVGLTVTDAMGRRAEVRDSGVRLADDAETRRAALTRKLAEAQEILAVHRAARDRECATGKGKLCDGKSYTVSTWEAAVAGYEARIGGLPAPRPVDAKGARVGALAGFFGYDKGLVQSAFALLEPFMLPALLELASIVLFGFGVGHARSAPVAPVAPVSRPVSKPVFTVSEPKRDIMVRHLSPVQIRSDEDRILDALRKRGGQVGSQDELGIVVGVSKGEISKMLRNCGNVERIRVDNKNVIRIRDASEVRRSA